MASTVSGRPYASPTLPLATGTTAYGLKNSLKIHAAAMSSAGTSYAVFYDDTSKHVWNRICAFDQGQWCLALSNLPALPL